MKRYTLLLVVGLIMATTVKAQDVRLLQTKVADILNQMPTQDLNQRDRVMEEMLTLGVDGLKEFTKLVVPVGTGDDTAVRFALNGLALYVGQYGKEEQRMMVSTAFTNALEAANDPNVKTFFLYHLKFFGKEEMVPVVEKYLLDNELYDFAVQALVNMNSHAGMHALHKALAQSTGKNQIRIVKGLGEYRAPGAEKAIRKIAGESNGMLKKEALYALSRIGSKESSEVMVNAARSVRFAFEPTEATPSLVRYTDQLAKNGELVMARRLCNMLVRECSREDNYTYALSALSLLTDHFGFENLDLLIAAMDHPLADYRAAALTYAKQITDIAALRKWMEKLDKLEAPAASQVITFLGEMGNPVVLPMISEYLEYENSSLRTAAVGAVKAIEGQKALPVVLSYLNRARAEELDQAKAFLVPLVSDREIPTIAASLDEAPNIAKPVLIEVIAEHKASGQFKRILKLTGSEDPSVANAAYSALKNVSTGENIGDLLTLLDATKEDKNIALVQSALVVGAMDIKDPAERTGLFIKAYEDNKNLRSKVLGVLPKIGGEDALKLVVEVYNGRSRDMKNLAFQALTQWKDASASDELFTILSGKRAKYKDDAFAAYVNQIRRAPLKPEQKLLSLRRVKGFASDAGKKERVLKALENIKTFPALVFVSHYLDDPDVASRAAWTASNIALPPSGTKNGMFGKAVKDILTKCIETISGAESSYAKENIRNWLAAMPKDDGFVSMFNGKDLSGWQGLVEDPIKRAKMSSAELAKKQAEADALVPTNWTVANNEIRFTGEGYKNLCSIKNYGDFELWVDWRITKHGDSGIYLRGTPQVQIWDTSRIDVGAQVGSGGLYNNQKNPSKPLKVADNPIDQWNTFFIRMIGDRVTVYLNGELVVDNVVLENYWDRTQSIFPTGPIELQAHGTNLAFRDIYVKEIKSESYNLTPEEQADGFVALFNGKNLDGWIGNKTDYVVEDGDLAVRPKGGGHGNLYTEKQYSDFAFRFEFQLTPGANNGIGIRTPPEGDAAYVGMEIQVLDNTAPIYAHLQPYQYHGSVYGVIPARRGFLKPVGEWNEEEIYIQGNHIRVTLNGTVIVDGDIHEASKNGTMDHNQHPGLKRKSGHIGFLGHGSELKFRNIRIREL